MLEQQLPRPMRARRHRLAEVSSVILAQDLMNRLGCGNLYHDGGFASHDADVRSNYIMNSSIAGADQADVVLFVGTNPRIEAPVFNARYSQVACIPALQLHLLRQPGSRITMPQPRGMTCAKPCMPLPPLLLPVCSNDLAHPPAPDAALLRHTIYPKSASPGPPCPAPYPAHLQPCPA